ncbi:MAG: hypothetical protein COW00_19140 [Bdellovibrio sp. CG12_big_fil_rev_8_21_14_0_65_39_13]|nr:MAG: hypothetical protein COW78_17135 [Bdellovibrio sp. CG22_combo_CG10-13_8_21_14_all_39_27]PIQ57812.1 MAG: hypothetical protein COW00_19140 [Bdellovibrio sp. CG12_big_fil_rev_8_21_14_0_65_39_13]PIR34686.1 MAG: hypothetical protein COV37_12190 [Bdellovibrio sp. CG11_big_fil_rev_8_21_14_0_20_39_38]
MRTLIISALLLLSSVAMVSYAQETPGPVVLEKPAGTVNCNEELERCEYITKNVVARQLIAKINAVLFPGTVLSPTDGYIALESLKKMSFWINDENLRDKFIAMIPVLDVLEDFDASALVQVTTEIFSLSDEGLAEMQAQISGVGSNEEDSDWNLNMGTLGTVDLALKVGNKLLSSVLGSKLVRTQINRVTTVTQLLPNLASIDYNHSTNVYVSPTAGIVKEEKAGLTLAGNLSISASDPDLVLLSDFSFRYGVILPPVEGREDRVSILNFTNPQLYMVKGLSNILVSSLASQTTTGRSLGLLSFGRRREKLQSKIMVITRAESMSFESYVASLKKLRQYDLFREFTNEEVEKLPESSVDLETVMKTIKPYSFSTPSGERVLGFTLDRKLARENNIKKSIEIEVKEVKFGGGGLKQKAIRTVENLMLSGLKFNPLDPKTLEKDVVKLRITLKKFNGRESVKKELFYNPETNRFITE